MTHTNFLGIPVEGDISKGDVRIPQRPLSELEPIIRTVVDDDTIHSFGWHQYTPYFNDGDPCIFSAYGFWIKTVNDIADDADDDDCDDDYGDYNSNSYDLESNEHPTLGSREYDYATKTYKPYEGPDEDRFDRCLLLSKAIEGGEFENVLLEAFGDHAEITVKRTGISVEFYRP